MRKRTGVLSRGVATKAAVALTLTAALCVGNAAGGTAAGAQDQASEVEEHLTEATKNSGGDLDLVNTIRTYSCDAVEDPDFYDRTSAERHDTKVPLTRVFDDLWYVGTQYVGQYILRTETGGFVLFDTQNNAAEVAEYTMPSLRTLGLGDKHPLEAVFVSHGHGDHDGGANQLRAEFGPDLDIYIGSADAPGKAYDPELIDSGIAEPQEMTVGGTTIVVQSIPGHTPGALNFLIPVSQGKERHLMLLGGRQGHPRGVEAAKGYLTGTERTYRLVDEYDADGSILTHPTSDGSLVRMQAIDRAGTRSPNPFVIGEDRTLRAAAIWRGCAAAWLASVDPATDVPVWRVVSLEIEQPEARAKTVTAQLETGWGSPDTEPGWGVVAGQTVTFGVTGSRDICTAVTDDTGVATCTLDRGLRPGQEVTASFEGSSNAESVDLPANSTLRVAAR
ncbi:MBL fold metallo-hydrolase [Nocardioides sp. NPDC059952]|uniref:MBL fold metallo-hydrolase n=1 Tax=Nocardioides sp. NPDC059952 TaxID=3347014 RepID=UPI003658CC81